MNAAIAVTILGLLALARALIAALRDLEDHMQTRKGPEHGTDIH